MIGIIGGYGDIGLSVTRILGGKLHKRLRVGGRNIEKVSDLVKEEFNNVELMRVDVQDADSFRNFINGCNIIVNCVGQIKNISSKLAEIAVNCGSHFIDLSLNKELEAIKDIPQSMSVVSAAGSIPGLSGILPIYLAEEFDSVQEMTFYYTALGHFSKTAARDYLEGLFSSDNKPMMFWQNGRIKPYDVKEVAYKSLPFSKKKVKLFPYFDEESNSVANKLKLEYGKWYMGVDGEQTLQVLEKARFHYLKNKEGTIIDLCRATEVDCYGRDLYAGFIIEMIGSIDQTKRIKTLIFKTTTPAKLTGLAAAATVIAVEKDLFPKGSSLLSECRDTKRFMQIINDLNSTLEFEILDGSIEELFEDIEGEI